MKTIHAFVRAAIVTGHFNIIIPFSSLYSKENFFRNLIFISPDRQDPRFHCLCYITIASAVFRFNKVMFLLKGMKL
jgi:hypothetical protein